MYLHTVKPAGPGGLLCLQLELQEDVAGGGLR